MVESPIDTLQLIPLHFTYPGVFWALQCKTSGGHSTLALQQDLTERITSYAASTDARLINMSRRNCQCIAMLDSVWARGQCGRKLRRKLDYLVEVFFIDYGVSRTIGMDQILEMPPIFTDYKPLAKRYGLYELRTAEKYESSSILQEQWGNMVDEQLGISHSNPSSSLELRAEVQGYVGVVAFVSCFYTDSDQLIAPDLISSGLVEEYTGLPSLLEHSDTESVATQEKSELSKLTAFSTQFQLSAHEAYHSSYHPQCYIQGNNIPPMVLAAPQCFSDTFITQLKTLSFPGPMLVQSHAWPIILSGRDLLCISPIQSGKTLSYTLPLLHRYLFTEECKEHTGGPIILVFCSSAREAEYVHMVCKIVVSWKDASKVNMCALAYQGHEVLAVDCLASGADILVCTPCSAVRLLSAHTLSLSRLAHLVFDTANLLVAKYENEVKLFMRGFATLLQEGTAVCNRSPPQILIFSTSYSAGVLSLMRAYTRNRITVITCPLEASVFQGLHQQLIYCKLDEKADKLLEYLQHNSHRVAICLSNLATLADVTNTLANNGFEFLVLSLSVESSKEAMQLLDEWEEKQNEDNSKPNILILFDDAIERFAINLSFTQVATLIHFEFPNTGNTKKVFRSRFYLLTESYNNGLATTCQSLIFLSKELGNKISYIFNFHTRLGNSIPVELSNKLTRIRETTKFSKQGDLCYYFKCFGECPNETCSHLHSFDSPTRHQSSLDQTDVIPPQDTPPSGSVHVLVSHVSNPSQIWVRILEHYLEKIGDVTYPGFNASQALTLNREIQAFSSSWTKQDKVCVPRIGQYYALYDPDDNLYYRVQTLNFSRALDQLIFFHREQVEVRCIDTGEMKVVYANQLLPLPTRLYQVPRQVVEMVCCRIKPVDRDYDWSPLACEFATRCLRGKKFTGRISYNFNGILFVDMLENSYSLSSLNITGSTMSYIQHIISKGWGVYNPTHFKEIDIQPIVTDKPTGSSETLELNSDLVVHISAIETPNFFYVQKTSNLDELDELNTALNTCTLPRYNPQVLSVGQLCVARLSVDDKLYRAKVVTVSLESSYEIFFIDYGDVEWVNTRDVFLISELFLSFNAQAIPCSLYGFEASNSAEASSETYKELSSAGDALWDITRGEMLIFAVNSTPSTSELHPNILMYSVHLYNHSHEATYNVLDALQTRIGLQYQATECTQLMYKFRNSCQHLLTQEEHSQTSFEELFRCFIKCTDESHLEVEDWSELGKCIAKSYRDTCVMELLCCVVRCVDTQNQGKVRLCLSQFVHSVVTLDLSCELKCVLFRILTVVEKCEAFYKSLLSAVLMKWIEEFFQDLECSKTKISILLFLISVSQRSETSAGLVVESEILKDWMVSEIPFVFSDLLVSLSGYSSLRERIVELFDWERVLHLISQLTVNGDVNECYSLFRLFSLLARNSDTLKHLLREKLQLLQDTSHAYNDVRINEKFSEIKLFISSQSKSRARSVKPSKYSLFRMPPSVPLPNQTRVSLAPLWSQTKTQIKISCKVESAISADIFPSSGKLEIFIRTRDKLYSTAFTLFAVIKKEISRHLYGIEVLFTLTKSERGIWPHLTTTLAEQKRHRIAADFDRFEILLNSSSEEERYRRTYVRARESSSEGSLSDRDKAFLSDAQSDDSPTND